MSATPLAGLKVLEFTHTVMGPTAGLLFAEMGADVIKIEPAPKGDHTRGLGGFAAGFFAAFNRNKRSLAIDLKNPEGQAAMRRLVVGAQDMCVCWGGRGLFFMLCYCYYYSEVVIENERVCWGGGGGTNREYGMGGLSIRRNKIILHT